MFNNLKIGIIGTGLIGSSIGLALKKNLANNVSIAGFDASPTTLSDSLKVKAIDAIYNSIEELVKNSDVIFIAIPIGAYEAIFSKISEIDEEILTDKIFTDAGSLKANPLLSLIEEFPESIKGNFVPAHPIAGKEKGGAENASKTLFSGKKVIVTPTKHNTDFNHIKLIEELWIKMGCSKISEMEPRKHDEIYGKISHLVQFLTYSIASFFEESGDLSEFSRLKESPKEVWESVFKLNIENIERSKNEFLSELRKEVSQIGTKKFAEEISTKNIVNVLMPSPEIQLHAAFYIAKTFSNITSEEERKFAGTGFESFTSIAKNVDLPKLSDNQTCELKSFLTEIAENVENCDISRDV